MAAGLGVGAGVTVRLGMKSDQPNVYFVKFNAVADTFHYRIEAGDAVTPEYTVTAVDPVQLTADSPAITVTPPTYARPSRQRSSSPRMAATASRDTRSTSPTGASARNCNGRSSRAAVSP